VFPHTSQVYSILVSHLLSLFIKSKAKKAKQKKQSKKSKAKKAKQNKKKQKKQNKKSKKDFQFDTIIYFFPLTSQTFFFFCVLTENEFSPPLRSVTKTINSPQS
jgi:mannitol-specific phosphotransferase system IIBC component